MFDNLRNNRCARLLAVSLALGAVFVLGGVTTVCLGAADPSGFSGLLRRWQVNLTAAVRHDFDRVRSLIGSKQGGAATFNLEDRANGYTVRLSLPNHDLDRVDVNLEGHTLRIFADEPDGSSRYEQSIVLSGVPVDAKMQVERRQKDGLIVITVPKDRALAQQSPPRMIPHLPRLDPFNDMDRNLTDQMNRMQQEMSRIFEEPFRDLNPFLGQRGLFDSSGFGANYELEENSKNYIVRVHVPQRDTNDVNVTVEGQTLKVQAHAETSRQEGNSKSSLRSRSQFSQNISLPGPVNALKMKVDRKDGLLIITLPKSDTA
jgi:HSP20 family protein